MSRTYVTLADPIHQLIRELTRHTPLTPAVQEDGTRELHYAIRPEDLPESYYSLAVYHGLQGLELQNLRLDRWRVQPEARAHVPAQVNFFDVVNLDRRCCRDIRLKLRKNGPGLLTADLLCYGVGTLRACNDDAAELVCQRLMECYGRIESSRQVVHARIHTLHWPSVPILSCPGKESFESTNMLYGDVHGELLQLWDRRAETDLLELVVCNLKNMRSRAEISTHFHPPLNLPTMIQLHLRAQSVWRQPPPSARALLRRLEYILDRTTVDTEALTLFHAPQQSAVDPTQSGRPLGWQADSSGYDGWLSRPGRAE